MLRFAPGFFGFALFVFWVWAVLDVIATDRILMRNLDKTVWLLLVIFVPTVGAVAWIALGRPLNAGFTPGSTARRTPSGSWQNQSAPRGLEDSDTWNETVRRRREQQLGDDTSADE